MINCFINQCVKSRYRSVYCQTKSIAERDVCVFESRGNIFFEKNMNIIIQSYYLTGLNRWP